MDREVFRAKDQKLGRDVAIKVLPEEFAKDADRVARFQREAKLLASLNHPNIASIYGLEESEGTHFLVLELIEGDTLADRIKGGPISVEESLKLAFQISEALEAAHEKGVIHRDLKPSNIKVTPEGKVKVLDFGLAKAYAGDREDMILSDSPTISAAATQKGVILGTAAYMSPEQAKGKIVDKRTDIWAFGAVLYEMLTGQAAFKGDEVSEILASVIKGDTNLDLLPANIHPRVRELLIRCLQKDTRRRYSGIGDARYDIEQVMADPSGVLVHPIAVAGTQTRLRQMLPWIAAIILVGLIVGLVVWQLRAPEPSQVIRFDYELPEDLRLTGFDIQMMAVSPDGKMIVCATMDGLFLRSFNEWEGRILPGTKGAVAPSFSPDGKWIVYRSTQDYKLKKVSIHGVKPMVLADAPSQGAHWVSENEIVFQHLIEGLVKISNDGRNMEILEESPPPDPGFAMEFANPQLLPDGKSVLYQSKDNTTAGSTILVKSLETGKTEDLFPGMAAHYVPTGHIIYASGTNSYNLYAVSFDAENLKVTGDPVPLFNDVINYAVSDSGILAYIPGSGKFLPDDFNLVWVDQNGNETLIDFPTDTYNFPKVSPDGKKIAVGIGNNVNTDIWILDLERKNRIQTTDNPGPDFSPLWTEDSGRILFSSGIKQGLFRKAADGAGEEEMLLSFQDGFFLPWSWANNGNTLVVQRITDSPSGFDIGIISMEGDRSYKPLLQEKEYERHPEVSPKGQWMAYASNQEGDYEVYIKPFPEVGKALTKVSTDGGHSPLWSPDGDILFYRNRDAVMAVPVKTEPDLKIGSPKVLFQKQYDYGLGPVGNTWDIHPDGDRFLMMKPIEGDTASTRSIRKIKIILNWFKELKEKVPVP